MNMGTAAPTSTGVRSPRHRVASADFASSEEFLRAAAYLVVPEDQSQRKAFAKLMPYLFVLRSKGCSFPQLAGLLTQCGLNLQPSSVRRYFDELLADRMEACEAQMQEQVKLLAEVRKETASANMADITSKVESVMLKRREDANAKLDQIFNNKTTGTETPNRPAKSITSASTTQNATQAPTREVAEPARAMESASSERAATKADHATSSTNTDTAQALPSAVPTNGMVIPTNDPHTPNLRCAPVDPKVSPLKKRDDVPLNVYQPGEMGHPCIPGLNLSLEQRLFSLFLEIIDDDGVCRIETLEEKRFRILWKTPIPKTKTRTSGDFVTMDHSLFPNAKK